MSTAKSDELREFLKIRGDVNGVSHLILDGDDVRMSPTMEIDLLNIIINWHKSELSKILTELEAEMPEKYKKGVPHGLGELQKAFENGRDEAIDQTLELIRKKRGEL